MYAVHERLYILLHMMAVFKSSVKLVNEMQVNIITVLTVLAITEIQKRRERVTPKKSTKIKFFSYYFPLKFGIFKE